MHTVTPLYRDSETLRDTRMISVLIRFRAIRALPLLCYQRTATMPKYNPLTAFVTCMYRIYRHVYDFYLL